MIQIVYFDEDEIKCDGIYLSVSEIKSCFFSGDSILCIVD